MNKLFTRIGVAFAGIAMAIGVGVAVGQQKVERVAALNSPSGTAELSTNSTTLSNNSFTDSKGGTWSLSYTASSTAHNTTYLQVGSNSKASTHITLTSSSFSSYVIDSISATVGAKSSTGAHLTIKIGSNDPYESEELTNNVSGGTKAGDTYTFNNTSNYTGNIEIKVSKASSSNGALYIMGLSVTYHTKGADPTVSSVTVTAGNKQGNYIGSAYIQCSATVNGTNNPSQTVTWALRNTNDFSDSSEVTTASIDNAGKVTLLAANVSVYAFATSTVAGYTSVRGSALCSASGLVSIPAFSRITSLNDLYDSMTIVIGASDYSAVLSTTQNSNNRGQVASTRDGSNDALVPSTEGWQELLVEVVETETGDIVYSFFDGTGYLYAAGSGDKSNYLRTEDDLDDNGRFNITISEGVASIVAQGTSTNNILKYNSSNSIFSCYPDGNTMADVGIFAATQTITDVQKCDTFVTRFMKMNSISTSSKGTAPYNACKANWSNVAAAYDALGEDAQLEFCTNAKYADARERLTNWATANNWTFDDSDMSLTSNNGVVVFNLNNNNNNTATVIAVIAAVSTLAIGGFFFLRKRKIG